MLGFLVEGHIHISYQCYFSLNLCFLECKTRQLNKPDAGKVYAVVGSTYVVSKILFL